MDSANSGEVCARNGACAARAPAWLLRLASLKLTLAVIVLLLAGSALALWSREQMTWPLVAPLALFALNLAAAVATNAAFRRQGALLVFHLALIALVLLVAAGRLTYLKGWVELADGSVFAGRLDGYEAGPWHAGGIERVSFQNLGFSIYYAPGIRRGRTRNRVRWFDADGVERRAVIGDMDPLVLRGYRFYTSYQKGYAPEFTWYPRAGAPQRGGVDLPAYPMYEQNQRQEWTPPGGGPSFDITLRIDGIILDPARPSAFALPKRHTLLIRADRETHEVEPGGRIELAEGTLVYEGLRTWMGYTVFYDWTLPWVFAASLVALLSLAWHYARKFAARPWLQTE